MFFHFFCSSWLVKKSLSFFLEFSFLRGLLVGSCRSGINEYLVTYELVVCFFKRFFFCSFFSCLWPSSYFVFCDELILSCPCAASNSCPSFFLSDCFPKSPSSRCFYVFVLAQGLSATVHRFFFFSSSVRRSACRCWLLIFSYFSRGLGLLEASFGLLIARPSFWF